MARLKQPELSEPIFDVLSDGEIVALLEAIKPNTFLGARMYAILPLLLDTGSGQVNPAP